MFAIWGLLSVLALINVSWMGHGINREDASIDSLPNQPGATRGELLEFPIGTPVPATIQSTMNYSTFLGGTGVGYAIAVDPAGFVYVTGMTSGQAVHTTPGANDTTPNGMVDVFVAKLSVNGSELVYSTFLGGASWEEGYGIAVDTLGCAYIVGYTESSNFPTTLGANDTAINGTDVFVTKLSADGSHLVYSTFIGGTGSEFGRGIAVDTSGCAYIIGDTSSSDFPTTPGANDTSPNGANDAFIVKLSADGSSLLYSTYLGGSDSEYGRSIAIDASGCAYVTGDTQSTDFPKTPGAYDTDYNSGIYDAFAAKLSADGSTLAYATYLGGSLDESGCGIAIDDTGCAYLTGFTRSSSFPTTTGAWDTSHNGEFDAYVAKLNPEGSALCYSTFLGGGATEYGRSITVDAVGCAYVTGQTSSANFPTTIEAADGAYIGGTYDGYFAKLRVDGSRLVYSTYIGGSNADDGCAIASNAARQIFITGNTQSSDFPITAGAYNSTLIGTSDPFVSKIDIFHEPDAMFIVDNTTPIVNNSIKFTFTGDEGEEPVEFQWSFGDQSYNSTDRNPVHVFAAAGDFSITLTITDFNGDVGSYTRIISVKNADGWLWWHTVIVIIAIVAGICMAWLIVKKQRVGKSSRAVKT